MLTPLQTIGLPASNSGANQQRRSAPLAGLVDIGIDSFGFGLAGAIPGFELLMPKGTAQPASPDQPQAPAQPANDDGEGESGSPAPDDGENRDRTAGSTGPNMTENDDVPASSTQKATDAQDEPAQTLPKGSRGAKAAATAQQEIGVREEPKGSNSGTRVDEYQGGPKKQYWCAHFVSWCFEQSGGSPFGHIALVAKLRSWGQSNGKYIDAGSAAPATGDIFTMARHDKAGQVVGGHTGFVLSYDEKTQRVRTVEGNISDKVAERNRHVSELDGFIRL